MLAIITEDNVVEITAGGLIGLRCPPSPSLPHCISHGVQQGRWLQPSQMGGGDPGSLSFPLVFSALLVALLGVSATPPRALG